MGNEKYIGTFTEYGKEMRRPLELDTNSLKDSLLDYILKNLTNSWPETCCQSTVTVSHQIVSLERISENGVEMVFPENVDLLKLFNVERIEDAYDTYHHDCTCHEEWERQKEEDEAYYERRGF